MGAKKRRHEEMTARKKSRARKRRKSKRLVNSHGNVSFDPNEIKVVEAIWNDLVRRKIIV